MRGYMHCFFACSNQKATSLVLAMQAINSAAKPFDLTIPYMSSNPAHSFLDKAFHANKGRLPTLPWNFDLKLCTKMSYSFLLSRAVG